MLYDAWLSIFVHTHDKTIEQISILSTKQNIRNFDGFLRVLLFVLWTVWFWPVAVRINSVISAINAGVFAVNARIGWDAAR